MITAAFTAAYIIVLIVYLGVIFRQYVAMTVALLSLCLTVAVWFSDQAVNRAPYMPFILISSIGDYAWIVEGKEMGIPRTFLWTPTPEMKEKNAAFGAILVEEGDSKEGEGQAEQRTPGEPRILPFMNEEERKD